MSTLEEILCSIDGIFRIRRPNVTSTADNPCNPLYWYPRQIPEYCYHIKGIKSKPPSNRDPRPIPMPIPIPIPPIPAPIPVPAPPILPPIIPQPIMPLPYSLPFGIPLAPTNPMLPVAGIPLPPQGMYPPQPIYPPLPPIGLPPQVASPFATYVPPYGIHRRPMSMVPGLPGLVAPDGGINILPFSDAYADLLEKHKQKMIRRRLQKLLDEYDTYNTFEIAKNTSQNLNDVLYDD